jgi:hypothetical protein
MFPNRDVGRSCRALLTTETTFSALSWNFLHILGQIRLAEPSRAGDFSPAAGLVLR